jgi:hypothetical protein
MAGGRGESLSMQEGTETRSEQHNSSAEQARARTQQQHKIFLAIYFSYLAKFGYKLNMKVNFRKKKKHPSLFLATYLNCVYRKLGIFLKRCSNYGY